MTLDPLQLVGIFYLGAVLQAASLILHRVPAKELWYFPLCFAWALLGFMPGKNEDVYDLYFHFLIVAGVFAVSFAWTFRKYLLDPINREILLAWNLILLYSLMRMGAHPYVINTIAIVSVALFANLFFTFDLRKHMQTALYAYFLCVVAGTGFLYLSLSHVSFFFNNGEPPLPSAASVFFAGTSLLYIAVNLWYVFQLNPIPGKHESWEQRQKIVREHATMMEQAYDESIHPLPRQLLMVGGVAVLLAGNFLGNFVSDGIAVPLAISLCSFGRRPIVLSQTPKETEVSTIDLMLTPDAREKTAVSPSVVQTKPTPSSGT